MAFLITYLSSAKHEPKRSPSGFDRANCWTRWTYAFVSPLLARGAQRPLQDKDLDHLSEDHRMPELVDRLEAKWRAQLHKTKPSLWLALYQVLLKEFIISGVFTLFTSITRVSQAVMLGVILSWMTLYAEMQGHVPNANLNANLTANLTAWNTTMKTDPDIADASLAVGFLAAFGLIAIAIAQIWAHHTMYYYSMTKGWMARLAITGLMQRKLLRLDTNALTQDQSHGKIVNLVSNDVARFDLFSKSVHFGWASILDLVLVAALMVDRVGWVATFAGIGVIVLAMPLQIYFGNRFAIQRKKTASYTDKRVRLTGEVFTGIITVKASVWEAPFREMVDGFRTLERRSIFVALTLKAINHSLEFATPYMSTACTFLVFWASGNALEVSTVFSTMALIHVLRISIGKHLTRFLEALPECLVSVSRLRDFLLLPERPLVPRGMHDADTDAAPRAASSQCTRLFVDAAVFSRRPGGDGGMVPMSPRRMGIRFTESAEERGEHWQRVVAKTQAVPPEAMEAPALLVQKLMSDIDLWRHFAVEFIFGGRGRIETIRRTMSQGSCEHIIVSRGASYQIAQALYAAGLHTYFSAVVDTEGNYLWPRPDFDPEQYGPAAFGDFEFLNAAFCSNSGLSYAYAKDLLLANQIKQRWAQILPQWSAINHSKSPRVVYIDDNPEVEGLPRHVKVVPLPLEGMHGFTSIAGCAALSQLDFETFGSDTVVVWDFDCTVSAVHLHKTINMAQAPVWQRKWGPVLLKWWGAHMKQVKQGQKPLEAEPSDGATSQHSETSPTTGSTSTDENATTAPQNERQVLECGPVNLKAYAGDLVVVTGDTGTGKSTLLHCLMQELRLESGSILVMTNRLSYCGQQPWIMAGTVRENILWGAPFNWHRYQHVLGACALRTDVDQLADGDRTEIGERGVNLSGGQKARVALARVMYARPHMCFLDDPLAAVDPRVGAHIMRQAVQSMQRDGVCVVLATHHVHIKEHADVVVHMQLDAAGDACRVARIDRVTKIPPPPPSARCKRGVAQPPRRPATTFTTPAIPGVVAPHRGASGASAAEAKKTIETKTEPQTAAPSHDTAAKSSQSEEVRQQPLKLVEAEERTLGNVECKTYHGYAKAAGYCWCVLIVILFAGSQAIAIAGDFWLKEWSDIDDQQEALYPSVFVTLTLSVVVLSFLRGLIFFHTALRAATNLHNQAYDAVVGSPLSFFTANPIGRILNKFSSDLGQVDEQLPKVLFECLDALALCAGSLVLCVVAVPWVLVALLPLGIAMYSVRRHFLFSARELKRMESTTKSPIFSAFQEQLTGLMSIRVFGKEQQLTRSFTKVLATYARTWYTWLLVNRWVGFSLDLLTTSMLAATVILGVVLVAADTGADIGTIAIAMTYAIQLSGMFQYMVRLSAQVETIMTSAERLLYYTTLEQEPEVRTGTAVDPPLGWPSKGGITVRDLCVRYRSSLPLVLRNVSLDMHAGTRVGIIGRTGSGKTSLSLALMRLNQIQGGSILLDGVNVERVTLRNCRAAVGYIPQQPVLFCASLRFNLDPCQSHSDEELWDALDAVKIKDKFQAQRRGLGITITEGGSNLSVGERQCISLARALLQKAAVYVLDEATANIDYEHDDNIQRTLREHPAFAKATLIIIAHRLNTIRDADSIVLLDDGKVLKVGPPDTMLADQNSTFVRMAHEAEENSTSIIETSGAASDKDGSLPS